MTDRAGQVSALEAFLRRDRLAVATGLGAAILLAWAYLLGGAGLGPSGLSMADGAAAALTPVPWTPGYAAVVVVMWWVMMVAMMLPGAAPMILLFAAIGRKRRAQGAPHVPTGLFSFGYLLAWGLFGLAATAIQWELGHLALFSPMMTTRSVALGGLLLIAAGLYQMTPLKHACLRHCRHPALVLTRHWRPGHAGALRMGLVQGGYCLGCCWLLMGLLFYGGVMNIAWIIGLALYVLVEKTLPAGHRLGAASGLLLVLWGGGILVAGA